MRTWIQRVRNHRHCAKLEKDVLCDLVRFGKSVSGCTPDRPLCLVSVSLSFVCLFLFSKRPDYRDKLFSLGILVARVAIFLLAIPASLTQTIHTSKHNRYLRKFYI